MTGIVFKATGTNISADGYYQINANGDVVLTTEGAKAGVNDFEQGPNSGDYVVVVSDAAGNKLETTITLKETDLDENSPTVGNTTISYAENQTAGAVLGNIGAADDKGVTGIVFKATGTNISADGYYQINANGDVVLTTEGAKGGQRLRAGPEQRRLRGGGERRSWQQAGNDDHAERDRPGREQSDGGQHHHQLRRKPDCRSGAGQYRRGGRQGVTGIVFKATGTNISADGYYQINANGDVVLTTEGAKAGVNDFEQGPNSGDYVVVVSDAAGNKLETTITLKETDLDENSPTVGNTTISYAENQTAGAVLGNIGAADDKGVTGIVFKATGTNISADGYYQINANGDVVLTTEGAKAGVNDFEQGPNSGDYVVVVSDAAGNKLETTITLKETDLDENSPTVGNTTISYAENQTAGAVLGNIGAADDKGVTGIVFKATGTNISADGYYQINANGDVVLTTEGAKAGVNDFEQGPNSGDYVVVVSDAAGNKLETTITLKETDLDENSPTVGNTTISYAENQTAGAVLGNIGAADDKGVTGIVFKATGTNISADGYYQINANGDVVLTTEGAKAGVNDFEQGPNSGDYVVVVSDAAGNKLETTITLKETDLDENSPTVGNTTISYAENQTAGAVLGNIGAADDKGVTGIVFKATGTNISADGYYQINANGDVVLTTEGAKAGVNDFEQGPNSGDYVVVVSDAAGNKLETTITLKETDLDENSPTVGNTTISYAENQTAGAVLGNIGAADDKGVTGIVFKATGTNISADGYYQINANGDVVLTTEGAKAGSTTSSRARTAATTWWW
ncbi:beta strand repeat-containing protein [Aeromonas veronii]|uniref:beta strand repeat-containing protein n=1 Tax=Aeromonas veronii TaxID=654 RepID=UPI00208DE1D4|nr:hypothetical protein [Aeromonas veronii]USP59171.1 hypothetical protein J6598_04340 [Aeromonas veronii]